MADVDYDALAAKYGGADAKPKGKVDYDALAAKYGAEQPPSLGSRIAGASRVLAAPGIGIGEAALQLASGAVATPVAGLAGIAQSYKNVVSPGMEPGDRVRQVQQALTYQPQTPEGQFASQVVNYLPSKLAEGADWAGGKTTDLAMKAGASPEAAARAGAYVNMAIQAAPAAIMNELGPVAKRALLKRQAELDAAKKVNMPHDEVLRIAKENKIGVSPSQGGGGTTATTAESIAGEPTIQKMLSKKNAPRVEEMVRQDVGLPEGQPVTRETLAMVRKDAGQAYDAIKDVGEVSTDAMYKRQLADISRNYDSAAESFSHRSENPFKKTFDGLNVDSFKTSSAIEEVKLLRADADEAFAARKSALGRAYKSAAQALDDQLDRSMTARVANGGDPALLDAVEKYKAARQQIAKTYTAEKALMSDGRINAAVYARELHRGSPLSGKGEQLAKIAGEFPRSVAPAERIGATGPTYFDAAAGLFSHHAPVLIARPLARSFIASNAYQSMLGPRTYTPSGFMTLANDLSSNPAAAAALAAQGQQKR